MSVCLFFMNLVLVRASAAKLCMVYPYVRGKVKTGSMRSRGVGNPPIFLKIFENFG